MTHRQLFNDAVIAADTKISLTRLFEDLDDGEVVSSKTGVGIEKIPNGLNFHLNNRIFHIDKDLFPHFFVGCSEYHGDSLAKFTMHIRKNKDTNAAIALAVSLVDELVNEVEPIDQYYRLLNTEYDQSHVVVKTGNKIITVGNLPDNCEMIIKR
jgi:hypothetical protein